MQAYGKTILIIFLLFFSGFTAFAQEKADYGDPLEIYTGEEGISIISYSTKWQSREKLKSVYQELLKNVHGKEIDFFSAILIYPDSPDGVASYYHDDYFRDRNGKLHYKEGRYIEIFYGDQYTELSQIARIISHEYGHHFTFYHIITKENKELMEWKDSGYAHVRGLDFYPQVTYLGNKKQSYSHKWDIAEILADDYVQLYGSELAKRTRDYQDVEERIHANLGNYTYHYSDFNVIPQENLDLPLAADVEGLMEYFYELSGERPDSLPEQIEVKQPVLKGIKNVYKNYNSYFFEWERIDEPEGENFYEYTLTIVSKENKSLPIPIKTVRADEVQNAVFGSAMDKRTGRSILENLQGKYELRLFVKDKNGYMHSSSPTTIEIVEKNRPFLQNMKRIIRFVTDMDRDKEFDTQYYRIVDDYPDYQMSFRIQRIFELMKKIFLYLLPHPIKYIFLS